MVVGVDVETECTVVAAGGAAEENDCSRGDAAVVLDEMLTAEVVLAAGVADGVDAVGAPVVEAAESPVTVSSPTPSS